MASGNSRSGSAASKIVLFSLLAIAVVLFGLDRIRGTMPQKRANDLLQSKLSASGDDGAVEGGPAIGPNVEFVTVDQVHELLHREPIDHTESIPSATGDSELIEIYSYPGVFNSYMLRVKYLKRAHVPKGGPATALSSVQMYTKGLLGGGAPPEGDTLPAAPPPPKMPPRNATTPDKSGKPGESRPAPGPVKRS